jgi:hypothetical protein
VIRRLGLITPDVAFAGGLLTHPNDLSNTVCAALGLAALPTPRYPPAVGAALLAFLSL